MQNDFVIDIQHLNKSFNGKPAVIDLALQVRRGEIFGFLGPNGSGKTTTLRMLCGLLIPDSGNGHCLGYDIITQSYDIKLHVGYMTQRFSLYEDLTVYENLNFIAEIYQLTNRKQQVADTLEKLNLVSHKDQLAGTLSGGWKQRLALASALLHKPKLLLLDEPTAGVDPKARRDFWDQIHFLATQGVTTLVSTHYMDEVERCNRIAYISFGKLLVQGTLPEVIKKTGLTTWMVSGDDLASLAEQLKKIPGLEQVSIFGTNLHVTSKHADQLARSIAPFQTNPKYSWQQIEPSMEDIFINLTSNVHKGDYD